MDELWWRLYRREWCVIFNSDATGDAGRCEALARADPEMDPACWRVVPWSEIRQDVWPWSLEVMAPVMRGEFASLGLAEDVMLRMSGAILVQKGSSEDKIMDAEQKAAGYLRG